MRITYIYTPYRIDGDIYDDTKCAPPLCPTLQIECVMKNIV
jgi:hypothetical protein